MPGLMYGGAHQTQNVIMLNQLAQLITIPAGTVIGNATPLDHPDAPKILCDWTTGHEDADEGEQLRQVYQLAETSAARERVEQLWQELDMDNPAKSLSRNGRKAMRKILA